MPNEARDAVRSPRLAAAALGVFLLVVAGRIVVEMWVLGGHLRAPIFTHQLAWFVFVLTWFAASLRRLAGLEGRALALLPLSGVVVFVPIVWALFSGQEFRFEYYHPSSPREALFDMVTLLYFHETNRLMFPELALLLAGALGLAAWSARRAPRALVAAGVAFYGAFFLAGFSTIRVGKSREALWLLDSGLDPHAFYSLQFIAMSLMAGAWLFWPEVRARLRELSDAKARLVVGGIVAACYAVVFAVYGRAVTAADLLVSLVPCAALAAYVTLVSGKRLGCAQLLIGGLLPALTLFVLVEAAVAGLAGSR